MGFASSFAKDFYYTTDQSLIEGAWCFENDASKASQYHLPPVSGSVPPEKNNPTIYGAKFKGLLPNNLSEHHSLKSIQKLVSIAPFCVNDNIDSFYTIGVFVLFAIIIITIHRYQLKRRICKWKNIWGIIIPNWFSNIGSNALSVCLSHPRWRLPMAHFVLEKPKLLPLPQKSIYRAKQPLLWWKMGDSSTWKVFMKNAHCWL